MKYIIYLILFFLPFNLQSQSLTMESENISIIPLPAHLQVLEGEFKINTGTAFFNKTGRADFEGTIKYFNDVFSAASGFRLSSAENGGENTIIIEEDAALAPEAYRLTVNSNNITIASSSAAGVFYAVQTMFQLLPPQVYSGKVSETEWILPAVSVEDAPRFKYRGMHLDVSRHFFPKEFVKKYIDFLAFYKLNRFHWHLVDDQGWRIEIKKYPRLTEVGAWRVDRSNISWRDRERQKEGEETTYGGFYTQEEIKEVVAYAKARHIEVLPEIEMPAHVLSALTAYPELSCTGGPFTVPPGTYWPNIDIYCAGKEGTFTFLEDVLTEVMEMFPYEYIHIGGDEADKTEWKKCPNCQQRIKDEGLKNEAELQSYFVKRIEKFLISKNKRLVGWDEILEGGLAPEATVMSWRGMQGGIEAAKQGHDVIMTPTTYCYFDYYQGNPNFEPEAIGGYLPLKLVYQFDPTPAELTVEEQKYILGGQANLWAEFIPTTSHAEYMLFPRLAALAEAVWTSKELKEWNGFASRINRQFEIYDNMGINYAKSVYNVSIVPKPDEANNQLLIALETESTKPEIYYTLDDSEPTERSLRYTAPLTIEQSVNIKATSFVNNQKTGGVVEQKFIKHLALLKKPLLTYKYSDYYKGGGEYGLTDGIKGTANYRDGYWSGFSGTDLEAVIDLGEERPVSKISSGYLQKESSWIFFPSKVEYYTSKDGVNFELAAEVVNDIPDNRTGVLIKEFKAEVNNITARYIKVTAKSLKVCPDWHTGAGKACWLLSDEIIIE